jgi:hypothetical protein
MPQQPNQAPHRGVYDWPAIEGQRQQHQSWVGMKLTALVLAAPLLAIGFLCVAYYVVKGLGILALIFKAVLA